MPSPDEEHWEQLDSSLRALGETQLQIQVATAIGYDTQALGLMAVGAALGGVLLALQGGLAQPWWTVSLVAAALTIFVCIVALSLTTTDEIGPSIQEALSAEQSAGVVQRAVLGGIVEALQKNKPALDRRRTATRIALGLLMLSFVAAVLAEGAARHSSTMQPCRTHRQRPQRLGPRGCRLCPRRLPSRRSTASSLNRKPCPADCGSFPAGCSRCLSSTANRRCGYPVAAGRSTRRARARTRAAWTRSHMHHRAAT